MKYINREYGFTGRPPYFKDYYEETYKGAAVNASNYPQAPVIGAGLDASVPNGALLVGTLGTMWGIRVSYLKNGKWYDSEDFVREIGRLYAVSRDGKFAYFSHGDMTATWVNYNDDAITVSISAMTTTKIRVIYYPKAPSEGIYKAGENSIRGSAPAYAVIQGKTSVSEEGCIFRNRFDVISDDKKEYFLAVCRQKPAAILPGEGNSVIYEYDLTNNVNSRLMIYAVVGEKKILDAETPQEEDIIAGISNAEIEYTSGKVSGSGVLGGAIAAALDSVMWFRIYNPYHLGTTFYPERNVDEYYSYDALEYNAALLAGAFVADISSCENSLIYAAQEKILSPITAWVVYSRRRNIQVLRDVYPIYKACFKPTDELVTANWKNKNEVAYRMPGSPLKENFRHENMYSLDLSCLTLLAQDILERMALLLGNTEDAKAYAEAKEGLKRNINATLFNDGLGIYMNRYVDGDFANCFGITSFYPLIAGVIDTPEKLKRTVSYLTNPKKFWGEYVLPSLSKDHYEYGVKYKDSQTGEVKQPFGEYRGMIIPYMNFLVYMGLARYGVSVAGEFASKCVKLYKRFYSGAHETYGEYLPTGRGGVGANHLTEGNLLALTGLCELIDVEYFRHDLRPALRFGTMQKGENSATNIRIYDRNFTIKVNDTVTYLLADGKEVFIAEGGKCEIRQFSETEDGCELFINSDANLMIKLSLPLIRKSDSKATRIIFAVEKGKNRAKVSNGTVSVETL